MGKSKHRKNHSEKLLKYKANKKLEQDSFKKKMIDNYMKMQQESLANQQEHTSTEEVVGPEIDLDDLNMVESMIEEFEPIDIENLNVVEAECKELEGQDFNQPLTEPIKL